MRMILMLFLLFFSHVAFGADGVKISQMPVSTSLSGAEIFPVVQNGSNKSAAITDIFTFIKSVDGAGSGLDSDLLDGQHGSYYQPAASAITTGNIGTQSVNYATSAGSAGNCSTLGGNSSSYYQPAASAITTGNIGTQSVASATNSTYLNGQPSTYYAQAPLFRTQIINHTGNPGAGVSDAISTTRSKSMISGTFGIINGSNDSIGWKVTVYSAFSDGTNYSGTVFDSGGIGVNYVVAMNPTFFYAPSKPGTHTFTITFYGGATNFINSTGSMSGMFSIQEF